MRKALAVLTLLSAVALAAAAPKAVPLEVTGDTVIVVRSFAKPVEIKAAPGADFYIWNFPDSFKAESADNVLTVTSAPKGSHKVTVVSVTIDFKVDDKGKVTKTVVKDKGEVTVNVGDVPGPAPDPNPPPDPTSPLAKSLKSAYTAEADPSKATLIKALAVVYETGAALVADGKARTFGALDKAMEAGAVAGGVSKKLPAVQGAIALYLKDKGLPFSKGSAVVIDDSNRDKTRGALTEVSLALKEVAP